jgi:hypothetical protein
MSKRSIDLTVPDRKASLATQTEQAGGVVRKNLGIIFAVAGLTLLPVSQASAAAPEQQSTVSHGVAFARDGAAYTENEGSPSGKWTYSARVIAQDHNNNAGRSLGAFYQRDHIIHSDGFWVDVSDKPLTGQ